MSNTSPEQKKKVFISMPMHGSSLADIRKKQLKIFGMLNPEKYELIETAVVVDPDLEKTMTENEIRIWCLGRSIQKMTFADLVIMAPGWSEANGCCVEREVAWRYGKKILNLDDDYVKPLFYADNVPVDDTDW